MTSEFMEEHQRLSAVFMEHFGPVTRLGDPDFEADWMQTKLHLNPWPVWDHKTAMADVRAVERSLMTLKKVNETGAEYWMAFFMDAHFRSQEFESAGFSGDLTPVAVAKQLGELHDLLSPSIDAAKRAVQNGYDSGKRTEKHWFGIEVISACRTSWWRCTGKDAPESMNPASPFGKFVEDVFEALQLNLNARASMDAWRLVQRKRENT